MKYPTKPTSMQNAIVEMDTIAIIFGSPFVSLAMLALVLLAGWPVSVIELPLVSDGKIGASYTIAPTICGRAFTVTKDAVRYVIVVTALIATDLLGASVILKDRVLRTTAR